jgi:hypothetical protein
MVKQVNALRDVYNENILIMTIKSVGSKTVLMVIGNFYYTIYVCDVWRKIIVNPYSRIVKFPSDIFSD